MKAWNVSDLQPQRIGKNKPVFDTQSFLNSPSEARTIVEYRKLQKIYAPGDPANNIFYIHKGDVRLSVANELGKEVVLGLLGPREFFGEHCLAGEATHKKTATAITHITLLSIEKEEMVRVLRAEDAFADLFMAHMLARNIRIEEDLVDQLFNSSEKRLARALLLLGRCDTEDQTQAIRTRVPQETLAGMIGTSRGRVNALMNQFRKRGFVKYNKHYGGLHIDTSLLSLFLRE